MPTPIDKARALYADLITSLMAAGRREQAMECAQLAVKQGIWNDPLQRPLHFVPSLPAVPSYDRRRFPVTSYLERHFAAIREEVIRVSDPRASGFTPVEEPLLRQGGWDQVMFYEAGQRFPRAASLFPKTADIIDRLPDDVRLAGVAMLSWLHPGSHIVPHCGHTNARLRIHLGIRTPPDALIRVKDRTLTWKEGECLVFDDSFEHEVWHLGTEPRVVLLVDMFHPALPEAERRAMLEVRTQTETERVRKFMHDRGLRRISRGAEDALALELDAGTELMLLRHMRDAGITAVDLGADGDLRVAVEGPS